MSSVRLARVDLDELVHDRAFLEPDDCPVLASPDRDVRTPVGAQQPLTPPERAWNPLQSSPQDIPVDPSGRWDAEAHYGNPEDGDAYGDLFEFFPHGSRNDDDEIDESAEDSAMVDYIVLVGAGPIEAKDRVHAIRGRKPTTSMEVYMLEAPSTNAITEFAETLVSRALAHWLCGPRNQMGPRGTSRSVQTGGLPRNSLMSTIQTG